jgi:uncharacterized phage protein gp47/JayE
MAFNIPNDQQEVIDRARTDVQNALPESNPFFKNSFLGALVVSFAGRIYDFYLQLNILIREMFPDTATSTFLERWGTYKDITRNPATQSTGTATATGTATSIIPISTQLQDAAGNQFVTTASATITATTVSITSLTRSGTTVTATTTSDHEFASNQSVTVAGAVETDYNGAQAVTVTAADVFTYEIATTPSTPATGTITASADLASIALESVAFGDDQNLASGTNLTFSSPISGVDDTAIVQFGEVAGGTDIESDADLRVRILDQYQNPIAQFNENAIRAKAKEVAGVTRVFITEAGETYGAQLSVTSITRSGDLATVTSSTNHGLFDCMTVTISGANEAEYNGVFRVLVISATTFAYVVLGTPASPATGTLLADPTVTPGQVIVFFTRDNDVNIIPSASEVTTTKNKILEIKPANTSDNDVIVNAPTANTVNFTFTALTPNTTTMQTAITANLTAFFRDGTTVGEDLKSFSYESAIFQTVDPETGDIVTDFTLSGPSGDVTMAADELPVLGSIIYP